MAKRRVKKSHLKRYASDYLNVLKGVDPVKVRSYHIFNNRQRVASAVGRANEKLPIHYYNKDGKFVCENSFTQQIPNTKGIPIFGITEDGDIYPVGTKTPRDEYEAKKRSEVVITLDNIHLVWQSELRGQGIEEFFGVTILDLEGYKLKLLRSGTRCLWVEEEIGVTRISRIYGTKMRAMKDYEYNRIRWSYTI